MLTVSGLRTNPRGIPQSIYNYRMIRRSPCYKSFSVGFTVFYHFHCASVFAKMAFGTLTSAALCLLFTLEEDFTNDTGEN